MADADVAPPVARGGASTSWRGLVGAYCWVEHRIFELTGAWATGAGRRRRAALEPASCGSGAPAVSRRHGALAGRWAERLPVRAGVDRGRPGGRAGRARWPGRSRRWRPSRTPGRRGDALVEAVLPRLQAVYGAHLRTASPVSEAPVLEVLAGARRDSGGGDPRWPALLEASAAGRRGAPRLGALNSNRRLTKLSVFPAVRPS